jgi:hypothetical protein
MGYGRSSRSQGAPASALPRSSMDCFRGLASAAPSTALASDARRAASVCLQERVVWEESGSFATVTMQLQWMYSVGFQSPIKSIDGYRWLHLLMSSLVITEMPLPPPPPPFLERPVRRANEALMGPPRSGGRPRPARLLHAEPKVSQACVNQREHSAVRRLSCRGWLHDSAGLLHQAMFPSRCHSNVKQLSRGCLRDSAGLLHQAMDPTGTVTALSGAVVGLLTPQDHFNRPCTNSTATALP